MATEVSPNDRLEAPAGDQQDTEGRYVYCIIQESAAKAFGKIGLGGRGDEVYTIHHRNLAAVVSDTPLVVYDPTRENALRHEQVNETVMNDYTVIPMSFGTVFKRTDDVIEFLKGTADALIDVLQKMRDKIELGLKVNWDRDAIIREIEQENEEIRRLKEEINRTSSSTYFARMQLGRLVEQAITNQADLFVAEVYDHLRDTAVASRAGKPIGDKMIMNAAFLVEREKASEFDSRVQDIARKHEGRLAFRYTGPWPPYNFVNIRLKLERAGEGPMMPAASLNADH
ncbi:MAG TPA: GvpL/GvpF family gas vesicle protein [Chloroflexota bacterium]|nr:GvpL/GvpF family gas vesicle protein [Chloroflexota bacterium]